MACFMFAARIFVYMAVFGSLCVFLFWHFVSLNSEVRSIRRYAWMEDYSQWRKNETLDRLVKSYVRHSTLLQPKPYDMVRLRETLNPCYSRRVDSIKVVDCLPLFYFGGFAKCSTTDIWRRLLLHPQFFNNGKTVSPKNPSPMKEYQFWTQGLFGDKMPLKDYMANFKDLVNHTASIVGDGSVCLFCTAIHIHKTASLFPEGSELWRALKRSEILAPHFIVQYVPRAKFVVMVREPAQRLYSYYLHMYSTPLYRDRPGWQAPSPDTFHSLVLHEIAVFKNCRRTKSARDCAYDETVVSEGNETRVKLHVGLYVIFIRDALQLVPRENIIVLRSEDYLRNRAEILGRVLQFMNLDHSTEIMKRMTEAEIHLFNKNDSTPFSKRVSAAQKSPMRPDTKTLLQEFYRPFNVQLAKLLNDNRFLFEDALD